jgi:hypothetical protein
VFRLFLEDFDVRAAKLRVGNIMQFYFEPSKLKEIVGDEDAEELQMAYRTFALNGRTLSDKRQGMKQISVVGKREDIPPQEELDVDEFVAKKQGIEMEKMVINAQYIKNFEVDITIIPESSYEQSRSLELAMQNEYTMTVAKLFPQKFMQYQDVFFKDLNEVYDKDETEFERAPKAQPQAMPQPGGEQGGPGIGEQLQGGEMNSLAKMVGAQV